VGGCGPLRTRRVFATAIGISASARSWRRGEQHSHAGSGSHPAGLRRLHDVPVGRLTLVRTFERSELVRVLSFVSIPPSSVAGGPLAGGLIVGYLTGVSFSCERADRASGYIWCWVSADYRPTRSIRSTHRHALFGGVALLSYSGDLRRAHAQRARDDGCWRWRGPLLAYWHHASQASILCCDWACFAPAFGSRDRSFVTRSAAGGMPFLLPLCTRSVSVYSGAVGLLIMRSSWPPSA